MPEPLELDRTEPRARLKEIGAMKDDDVPVAEAALLLAALDRPALLLDPYFAHLGEMTGAVSRFVANMGLPGGQLAAGTVRARALSAVIGDEFGYSGDRIDYDDLRNANLIDVIERRKGLPVALGILYIHCARRLGWDLAGLSFPGHFVVGLRDGTEHIILDPFNGGRILHAETLAELLQQMGGPSVQLDPAMIEHVDNRAVLLRLENNIKTRLVAQGEYDKAADVIQRMVLIAPDEADLWLELGEAHAHGGRLGAAIQALKNCLAKNPAPALKHEAALALDTMQRKLN